MLLLEKGKTRLDSLPSTRPHTHSTDRQTQGVRSFNRLYQSPRDTIMKSRHYKRTRKGCSQLKLLYLWWTFVMVVGMEVVDMSQETVHTTQSRTTVTQEEQTIFEISSDDLMQHCDQRILNEEFDVLTEELEKIMSVYRDPLKRNAMRLQPGAIFQCQAISYFHRGMIGQSIELFKKAEKDEPKNEIYKMNLGAAQQQGGYVNDALDTYNRLLSIYPQHFGARQRRAHILMSHNSLEEAIEEFGKLYNEVMLQINGQNNKISVNDIGKVDTVAMDFASANKNFGNQGKAEEILDEAAMISPKLLLRRAFEHTPPIFMSLKEVRDCRAKLIANLDSIRWIYSSFPGFLPYHDLNSMSAYSGDLGYYATYQGKNESALRTIVADTLVASVSNLRQVSRFLGVPKYDGTEPPKGEGYDALVKLLSKGATKLDFELNGWMQNHEDFQDTIECVMASLRKEDRPFSLRDMAEKTGMSLEETTNTLQTLIEFVDLRVRNVVKYPPTLMSKPKVCFFSGHVHTHAVTKMFGRMFSMLPKVLFYKVLFAVPAPVDSISKWIFSQAEKVIMTPSGASPNALEGSRLLVTRERCDIIVNPELGMHGHAYTLAFSRLAPVQINTHGNSVTSGIRDSVDYYVSFDDIESPRPEESVNNFVEQIVRLDSFHSLFLQHSYVPDTSSSSKQERYDLPVYNNEAMEHRKTAVSHALSGSHGDAFGGKDAFHGQTDLLLWGIPLNKIYNFVAEHGTNSDTSVLLKEAAGITSYGQPVSTSENLLAEDNFKLCRLCKRFEHFKVRLDSASQRFSAEMLLNYLENDFGDVAFEDSRSSLWANQSANKLPLPHYLIPQTSYKLQPDFDDVVSDILLHDPCSVVVLMGGTISTWNNLVSVRMASHITAKITERVENGRITFTGDSGVDEILLKASGLPNLDIGTLTSKLMNRIIVIPQRSHESYLEMLARADVIVDTFPYGGCTSSYEALIMGTPVVTLPSRFAMRSRFTMAMLRKMGLEHFIAKDYTEFIQKLTAVANERVQFDASTRKAEQQKIAAEARTAVRDLSAGHEWVQFLLRSIGSHWMSVVESWKFSLSVEERTGTASGHVNEKYQFPVEHNITHSLQKPQTAGRSLSLLKGGVMEDSQVVVSVVVRGEVSLPNDGLICLSLNAKSPECLHDMTSFEQDVINQEKTLSFVIEMPEAGLAVVFARLIDPDGQITMADQLVLRTH